MILKLPSSPVTAKNGWLGHQHVAGHPRVNVALELHDLAGVVELLHHRRQARDLRLVEQRRRALVGVDVVQRLVAVLDLRAAARPRCPGRAAGTCRRSGRRSRRRRAARSGRHALGDADDDVLEAAARRRRSTSSSFIGVFAQNGSASRFVIAISGGVAGQLHGARDRAAARSRRAPRGLGAAPPAAAGAAGAARRRLLLAGRSAATSRDRRSRRRSRAAAQDAKTSRHAPRC